MQFFTKQGICLRTLGNSNLVCSIYNECIVFVYKSLILQYQLLQTLNKQKVIFLDRDGILNIEKGHYITHYSDLDLNALAIPFLQQARDKGYVFVVITNQGGIAKGLYSATDLAAIHQKLVLIYAEYGIAFKQIYYCPHHPDFGKCLCRKPQGLMVQRAAHALQADRECSFMIGDRQRDVFAAENAGFKGVLVDSNSSLSDLIPLLK